MNLLKWLSPFFMVELTTLWGGKGSSPPPPDYTGAAREQAAASQELATQNTWANRPTQNTPWGSTTWEAAAGVDPSTGQAITQWTQNQTLDPALQSALNDQLAIQGGRSQLAGGFMDRVAGEYAQPFDWTNLPGVVGTPQQQFTYGRQMQTGYGDPYRLSAAYMGSTTDPNQQISPTGQDMSGLNRYSLPWERVGQTGADASRIGSTTEGGGPGIDLTGQNTGLLQGQTTGRETLAPTGANTGLLQGQTTGRETLAPTGQQTGPISAITNAGRYGQAMTPTGQQMSVAGQSYDLSAPGQTTQTTNALQFGADRQRLENAAFQRMQPEHDRQRALLENQLINQGFTRGSEAFKEELKNLGDVQARERFNALEAGGSEQARMTNLLLGQQQQAFGQDVTSQQAQNAARQMQFGQGLQQGQFANQAMNDLFRQRQAAGQFGLGAEQQQFGQQMASQQQQNQALQNLFQQRQAAGQFGLGAQQQAFGQQAQAQQQQNAALQQLFGQRQAAGQFGLGAQQQAFGQQAQAQQQQNQALQQLFAQRQGAGQFDLSRQQQAFGQDVAGQEAYNRALQQRFQQGATAEQLGQAREQQAFGQDAASQQARNQAMAEMFRQQQAAGQFGLAAQQQGFGQNVAGQEAYNRALGQQQNLDMQRGQFYNQAQQQMFGQDQAANQQNFQQMMAAAEYQNRLRQQAIGEQQMQRGMSLNELNALLTGQQVASPQMPGFNTATMGQAPNLLGAAQAQGQYGMQAAQMQQQADQNMWGNIGQMAGMAAMFMSDRRLKSNIVRVGTHPLGIGVYEYDIFGHRERGVMADEVLQVRPDLVALAPSGFMMVNYGGL